MHTDPSPVRALALLLGLLCGVAGLVAAIAGAYTAAAGLFTFPALAWSSFSVGRAWERSELLRGLANRQPQPVTKNTKNTAAKQSARLDA